MTPLYQELNRWAGLPFLWGKYDCCMLAMDWCERILGQDPAADLRGRYGTLDGAYRIGWFERPVELIAERVEPLGIRRVQSPQDGDLAVLAMIDDPRNAPHAGIHVAGHWAAKSERGVVIRQPAYVSVSAIWGLGYDASS